jgi:hypothetical protein
MTDWEHYGEYLVAVGPNDKLMRPDAMHLGEIIDRLMLVEDKSIKLKIGFHAPHSYRGDYSEVAFKVGNSVTVETMLEAAKEALNNTYEGWKGGSFKMSYYTSAWLVQEEGMCGEMIGAIFLELLLANREE